MDEAGNVAEVAWTGSDVLSHVEKQTYPPVLSQLSFRPARIRGHAVEAHVLATVAHTFEEGANAKRL